MQATFRRRTMILAIVEGGLMVALAFILSFVKVFEMPQGGSINLTCLPLIVYAFRWGSRNGLIAALAYGVLHFLLDPYHVFHPISILGDYLVSYGLIAIVGIGSNDKIWKPAVKSALVFIGRYITGTLSGAIVFGSYAPEGMNPWIYSLGYNSYLFVEGAAVILLFCAAYGLLTRLTKPRSAAG